MAKNQKKVVAWPNGLLKMTFLIGQLRPIRGYLLITGDIMDIFGNS